MHSVSTLLASVAALGLAAGAGAQIAQPLPAEGAASPSGELMPQDTDGLADIVVTAQKREQNLQDVPAAITALSGDALQSRNINQVADLAQAAPSLTVTQGTSTTTSSLNLRGIGTFAYSIGIEPSVAIIVDDVALLQQAQAFSNLSDVARIEVLRGPQGTLFGKNASAGAINIVTKAPTKTLSGTFDLAGTTDDEYRGQAALSGPIGDAIGFRLNGFYGHRRGYIRNVFNGHDLGNDESWGVRGRLRIEPASAVTVDLTADHSETRTNGLPRPFRDVPAGAAVFGSPLSPDLVGITPGAGNARIRENIDPSNVSLQTSGVGRIAVDLGGAQIISVSSYQDWKYRFVEDVDMTTRPVLGIPGGLVQSSPFHAKQFAQEVRIVSTISGPVQYLVGLYYSDGSTTRSFSRGPSGPLLAGWAAKTGTKSYAGFGQVTYDLGPSTHLDGGVRFNREEISAEFRNLITPATAPANNATCLTTCVGTGADNAATGKVALRQDVTERVHLYGSFATGYKGQGYDISTGFTPAKAAAPVRAEHSKAYEIGLKSRFLDNRVQLNIAAFLTNYNDFQAQSAITQPNGSILFTLNNVGKLRTKGVEAELSLRPVSALRIEASGAYTDATIIKFPGANCYTGQTAAQGCVGGVQDLAGARLANAPTVKYTISASYDLILPSLPFDAFLTADYRHQSSVNFDLARNPLTAQDGYGVVNGSIGVKSDRGTGYRVVLFVNNLFDKAYVTNIGLATGGSAGLTTQVVPRDARRYGGVRLNYVF